MTCADLRVTVWWGPATRGKRLPWGLCVCLFRHSKALDGAHRAEEGSEISVSEDGRSEVLALTPAERRVRGFKEIRFAISELSSDWACADRVRSRALPKAHQLDAWCV